MKLGPMVLSRIHGLRKRREHRLNRKVERERLRSEHERHREHGGEVGKGMPGRDFGGGGPTGI